MICSAYIFGKLNGGYTQFPDDSSSSIFRKLPELCTAPAALIIHRDECMMYYTYIRKFEGPGFIGFAIALNGRYICSVRHVMNIFKEEVELLAKDGVIVQLSTNGNLQSGIKTISSEAEEAQTSISRLLSKFESSYIGTRLPVTDYSVAANSKKIFSIDSPDVEVVNASIRFGYTIVLYEKDFDTVRMSNYRNSLKRLKDTNKDLIREKEALELKITKIQQQKNNLK